jgi:hypothetical protein
MYSTETISQTPTRLPHSATGVVDTTLLFEELKRAYARTHEPVTVNFRKLVSWMKAGDQFTHQIHPYPAKLLPHIAHFFINNKSGFADKVVLDPFCGSGTVALEASLAGNESLVADANPLATLITTVKTTPYSPAQLREGARQIAERAIRLRGAPAIDVVNSAMWYAPDVKRRLDVLRRAIDEHDNVQLREFFLLAFSVTARRVSRTDPSISVPVRLRTKDSFNIDTNTRITEKLAWLENVRPVEEFLGQCHSNIARVEAANRFNPQRKPAKVISNDARDLPPTFLPTGGVPLIITSPPYGTAQKYVRASSLSLNWLGFASPDQLSSFEGKSIGREHSPAYRKDEGSSTVPVSFETLLSEVNKINPLRAKITRQYLFELKLALLEMHLRCATDGRIVIVIGNNHVCGFMLKTNEYIATVMLELGCELEVELVDHIQSRGLLTKRNSGANIISREHILVFKKRG